MTKAQGAASDFFAIIDAPKPTIAGLRDPDVSAQSDIVFDSVTFAYPSRPHVKVLDDCNLRFEAGKITAIVGASGSGKSTIVGLLERWYDLNPVLLQIPESAVKDDKKKEEKKLPEIEETKTLIDLTGSLLLGKENLDNLDLKWWRSQIGLVQQEPFIFNDTIAKNIEHGLLGSEWENVGAEEKRKLVEDASKEAFADEFISRLPLVSTNS